MAKRKMAAMDDWLSTAGDAGRTLVKVPAGVGRWEPNKAGETLLDVVPYPVKSNPLYKEKGALGAVRKYYMHWGVGPNREPVFCNAGNFGKPCPVCEYTAKLWADPEQTEENQKVAKDLKKKERELWNVHLHAEKSKGVQILDISSFAFGDNLANKINLAADEAERRKRKAFADPDRGYSLLVMGTMEPSGAGKPYYKASSFEFRKRKEPLPDDLLEKAVCLDDLVKMEDYKAVKEKLHGGAADADEPADDDDDTVDEASDVDDGDSDEPEFAAGDEVEFTYKKKVRRGTVKRVKEGNDGPIAYVTVDYQEKPAVVAVEDLTLVDDDGDDDDDFPAPAPSKNGKRKAEAVDEDDDEPDDEESDLEDDDDPPASRPKRTAGGR